MKNKNRFKISSRGIPAIIVFVALLGVVGATIAFNHDRSILPNRFNLASYKTLYTEDFEAPENWITCQTIDKTLTVTNDASSSGPVSVRVRLEEKWLDNRGREMPLVSENSGLTMAQINFTENSGWVKDGMYYYYENDLAPGETTSSLISGVTLNCDANLDSDSGADRAYAGRPYYLKMVAQTIESEHKNAKTGLYDMITSKAKQCDPDWSRGAKVSDDATTSNCNGINQFTEKGQTVAYLRGEVPNSTVVWGDMCWKMMRTTYTGGVKLVYYSNATVVDGAYQCKTQYNYATVIRGNWASDYGTYTNTSQFPINYYDRAHSGKQTFADNGYMYNEKIYTSAWPLSEDLYVFSKNVTRSGNTYTLDTSEGNSISDTLDNNRFTPYRYFCTDGTSSCDDTKIGYYDGGGNFNSVNYYPIGGYDDYYDFVDAAFDNVNDSIAKTVVETWFVNSGLSAHEDELEDAIFCNDRSYTKTANGGVSLGTYDHLNAPSLDCPLQRDAFTKSDTVNGNGKLGHKVGLLTADEITMGGQRNGYLETTYLSNGPSDYNWTMTPSGYGYYYVVGSSYMFTRNLSNDISGFRPSVSLKAGAKVGARGEGTFDNPYVVEF